MADHHPLAGTVYTGAVIRTPKKMMTGSGAPSFCWQCGNQLHRAPGKGQGLFFFNLVTGPDGHQHRIHGDCTEQAILDGCKLAPPADAGVETGEPRGPVHSCKNCAHFAKDSCDDPCAGCTVRWRSGVSDRWEPALGVRVAHDQPSAPSPTDGSAKENQALRTLSRLSDEMGEEL